MNKCIDCELWSDFDGLCWCALSPNYLDEVTESSVGCEYFDPWEEDKLNDA